MTLRSCAVERLEIRFSFLVRITSVSFFNAIGADRVIEFGLQDGELLSKNEDFKVFLQMREPTDGKDVENSGEDVLDDEPTHLILCS